MAKQKKAAATQARKEEEARRYNVYKKRVFNLLRELGYSEAIQYIDRSMLRVLYSARPTLLRINAADMTIFNKEDLDIIKSEFYYYMDFDKMPFTLREGEKRTISALDFYDIWMPLSLYLLREPKYPEDKIYARIVDIIEAGGFSMRGINNPYEFSAEFDRVLVRMEYQYTSTLMTYIFQLSNPCMHLLWFKKRNFEMLRNRVGRTVDFSSCKPQSIWGTDRKGERRLLFRVGFPDILNDGLRWLSACIPHNPYIPELDPDRPYDVYIQEHAIKRMFERVDGLSPNVVNTYMNFCFTSFDVDWYKGSLLISFSVFSFRVGYFFADFTRDRKIVIRTFYFITYDHTPEGEILSSYAGLKALDKRYLCIDRLSTFFASKIDQRSRLASLFREAGCEHLLRLNEMRELADREEKLTSISNEFIEKYLSSLDDDV